MNVDIIIVSYNTRELLHACLASIRAYAPAPATRTFVVDNASSDGSPIMVAEQFPEVHLIRLDSNIGFGAANNRALCCGDASFILFLNPDTELSAGALEVLLSAVQDDPRGVIAAPRLHFPGGRFQVSCRRFPTPLRSAWSLSGMEARFPNISSCMRNWFTEEEHRTRLKPDMVSGACFLARREYIERLGGFDENLFMYEEETDLMLPARTAGFRIIYRPDAHVLHHGGAAVEAASLGAFSLRQLFRSKYYCFRKHYGRFAAQRAYWLDRAILHLSASLNTVRGTPTDAAFRLRCVRRAWKESFMPIQQLRESKDFFKDN